MRISATWLLRIGAAICIAGGVGFLPHRVYGPAGIHQVLELQRDLGELEADIIRLRQENISLGRQIRNVHRDSKLIERIARNELGLVRPEELVFFVSGPK